MSGCGKCGSNKHGSEICRGFACFRCFVSTGLDGESYNISRTHGEDWWMVEVTLDRPEGRHEKQWIHVSDPYEEAYILYVARLIVT